MGRSMLGELEQLVLLAILRLGPQAYGGAIIAEIEARTGRRSADAAVYVVLRRLERKGYLTARMADASDKRGGRRRRYFTVQPDALALLRSSRTSLLSLWDGLENILEER